MPREQGCSPPKQRQGWVLAHHRHSNMRWVRQAASVYGSDLPALLGHGLRNKILMPKADSSICLQLPAKASWETLLQGSFSLFPFPSGVSLPGRDKPWVAKGIAESPQIPFSRLWSEARGCKESRCLPKHQGEARTATHRAFPDRVSTRVHRGPALILISPRGTATHPQWMDEGFQGCRWVQPWRRGSERVGDQNQHITTTRLLPGLALPSPFGGGGRPKDQAGSFNAASSLHSTSLVPHFPGGVKARGAAPSRFLLNLPPPASSRSPHVPIGASVGIDSIPEEFPGPRIRPCQGNPALPGCLPPGAHTGAGRISPLYPLSRLLHPTRTISHPLPLGGEGENEPKQNPDPANCRAAAPCRRALPPKVTTAPQTALTGARAPLTLGLSSRPPVPVASASAARTSGSRRAPPGRQRAGVRWTCPRPVWGGSVLVPLWWGAKDWRPPLRLPSAPEAAGRDLPLPSPGSFAAAACKRCPLLFLLLLSPPFPSPPPPPPHSAPVATTSLPPESAPAGCALNPCGSAQHPRGPPAPPAPRGDAAELQIGKGLARAELTALGTCSTSSGSLPTSCSSTMLHGLEGSGRLSRVGLWVPTSTQRTCFALERSGCVWSWGSLAPTPSPAHPS